MTITLEDITTCENPRLLKMWHDRYQAEADEFKAEAMAGGLIPGFDDALISRSISRYRHAAMRRKAIERRAYALDGTVLNAGKIQALAELQMCIDRQRVEIARLRELVGACAQ